MSITPSGRTIAGVTHHEVALDDTTLHYVSSGTGESTILLVHGFPETWWAFRGLIPLLSRQHHVIAVDLRGFGDSAVADDRYSSAVAAQDLHELITHVESGPVHLVAQDIAGGAAFRLAATHPEDIRSFTAIEMGLAGFGLEAFGDVTHGGSWHIGVLATPGIADLLLAGREREVLRDWAYPSMTAAQGSITSADIDEFTRTYARPGGWNGAVGLYRSMLAEGEEFRGLGENRPLSAPALAIGAGGGPFTAATLQLVSRNAITTVHLDGVGHYAAQEAPIAVAEALLELTAWVDGRQIDRIGTPT